MSVELTESCFDSEQKQRNKDVPQEYYQMPLEEIHRRGAEAKRKLGEDLMVLCHHYQQDGTYWFRDVSGDSLYLAQQAAQSKAKYIVFCGVHFMAESADIVTRDDQIVILPDLTAGCSMADMADVDTVENAWSQLTRIHGDRGIVPITYINSAASLKAFCGRNDGTVCTSSNSIKILKWALDQDKRVLFFPDQHLGRNSANELGVDPKEIVLWQRDKTDGGLTDEAIANARIILWDGYCSVHCRFDLDQIADARRQNPDIKVVVHPECPEEVVKAADFSGSTNKILSLITESPAGSKWAVGTEISMVKRLSREMAADHDKYVECLNPTSCQCTTMFQIFPGDVLWILENLVEGKIVNRITVEEPVKHLAHKALDKMLDLSRA